MKGRMHHAGLTDKGRVREQNEDAWSADPKLGLYVVSDGLGGEFAGALASKIVVEALPALICRQIGNIKDLSHPKAAQGLIEAITCLSLEMRRDTKGKPALEGMGATVVVGLIRGSNALLGHMGDSRAYLWRQRTLEQVTKDHSIVQILLDHGEITPEEAPDHPARARVTRFVGMFDEPLPEARLLELQPGDRLLFCTDGLTGMLSDMQILGILNEESHPKAVCQRLVAAANEAGGRDNITVLLVSVEGIEKPRRVRRSRSAPTGVQGGGRTKRRVTAERLV